MKNENFKLILNGLIILLGASALVYGLNNITPIHYQFNSEIWGTVSDWIMVVVTAITGIAIWKTLNTAMQSQKTQDALLREEIKRTKLLLQPIISADNYDKQFWKSLNENVTGTKIKQVFMIRISSKERFARNINVTPDYEKDEISKKFFESSDFSFLPNVYPAIEDEVFRQNIEFKNIIFYANEKEDLKQKYYRRFKYSYEDQAGNTYELLFELRISRSQTRNVSDYTLDKISIVGINEL